MKTWIKNPIPWLVTGATLVVAAWPSQALTPAEATGILFLKQEEKLARDIYQALAVRWDQVVFRNIAVSEQRHMDAVDGLIARYGLQDTSPAEPGKFSIPELQKLYDDLLSQGQGSLTEALRVGVAVEETDIADLKEAIAASTEAAVLRVFGNLLQGSTRHLAAFNTVLTSGGTCPGDCTGGACNGTRSVSGKGRGGNSQGMCARDGSCPQNGAAGAATCPMGTAGNAVPGGNKGGSSAGNGRR